ncbi:MAG: aminodeoxychorismate synthase component I [Betaproteobacteria bacterium]|nr:aminodeoxychorismate synthase component I [Betaproteobacteria bacterium]
MARTLELPYNESTGCADRHAWFERIRPLGWAVFLDSGERARTGGRFDILAAGPQAKLVLRDGRCEIERMAETATLAESAFAGLRLLLAETTPGDTAWPIAGGAIGYVGYELGRQSARLPPAKPGTTAFMPEAAVGLYPWTVVVDHAERRAALTSLASYPDADAEALREVLLEGEPRTRAPFCVTGEIASSLEREAYLPRAARIIDYIRAGDTYQVNLTREFRVAYCGDAWEFYRHLHDTNPAPMGAFLEYPFGCVLSSSPERLMTVEAGVAMTQPIKGTRRRRADPGEDARVRAELEASAKDRAENVMIVDLLRNDFGRVCEPGSVAAPRICELESFATVHHLVSTVTGRLAPGRDGVDLLQACFPGGSITGTPKRRAMEIIDELEPHRREVYCGAIGYATTAGRLDVNIPIRTTLAAGGELRFYAGGGIVADSSPESEFEETEVKVAAIRRALSRFAAGGAPHSAKSLMRRELLAHRDALFSGGSSAFAGRITARLRALIEYRRARTVLATFSFGTEWDTRAFADGVLSDGKVLVLPRVVREPRSLELYAVTDLGADLVPGVWSIEEPDPARCRKVALSEVDFALVPALSCNRKGVRLGYGAGYFDRLLAGAGTRTFRVVALPAALVREFIPCEPHDVPVDALLTEDHFQKTKPSP